MICCHDGVPQDQAAEGSRKCKLMAVSSRAPSSKAPPDREHSIDYILPQLFIKRLPTIAFCEETRIHDNHECRWNAAAINAQKNLIDRLKLYQEDITKGVTAGTLALVLGLFYSSASESRPTPCAYRRNPASSRRLQYRRASQSPLMRQQAMAKSSSTFSTTTSTLRTPPRSY